MNIFLLIYIPGIIATLWILYHSLSSGDKVTISYLLIAILLSIFSWIAFITAIIWIYGDTIIFRKK